LPYDIVIQFYTGSADGNAFFSAEPFFRIADMNAATAASLEVFAVLSVATLACRGVALFWPSEEIKRVWVRIKSWWVIAAIPLLCLSLGPLAVSLLFVLVIAGAVLEFLSLIGLRRLRGLWIGGSVAVAICLSWHLPKASSATGVTYLLGLAVVWGLLTLGRRGHRLWGSLFLAGSLGLVPVFMRILPIDAFGAVFFLLFITSLNDVFQYLAGKAVGGWPLAPTLSPRKTWSGFIGGLIGSGLTASLLGPHFLSVHTSDAFMVGVLLATAGTLGDLTVSLFKRRAEVADTGRLLPGHGGLLDRLDSLCLTAPAFYGLILLKVLV